MGNLIEQPNTAPGGSTSISGNYSQNESNRTTYATIGNLDSTLTSSTHNITGGDFEGGLTVDHRLLSEAGRENIVKDMKLSSDIFFGTNLARPKVSESGTTSADAVPGTLPWLSRWVNENNKVVKSDVVDGKIVLTATDYPAPNLLPGFGNEPIMGITHKTCQGSFCYYLASDQAPLLKVIHQTFPGADSSSAFHDAGKYPNDPITTFVTIPPYFAVNIIGAIGTFFDVGNWKQNFVDPKTSIFTKPQPVEIQQLSGSGIIQTNYN